LIVSNLSTRNLRISSFGLKEASNASRVEHERSGLELKVDLISTSGRLAMRTFKQWRQRSKVSASDSNIEHYASAVEHSSSPSMRIRFGITEGSKPTISTRLLIGLIRRVIS